MKEAVMATDIVASIVGVPVGLAIAWVIAKRGRPRHQGNPWTNG